MLARGEWQQGWKMYEQYVWNGVFDEIESSIPKWQGEDVRGKRILILPMGGLGDQILFFRWFHNLRERGAHITWMLPDRMECLFSGHSWVDRLIPVIEGEFCNIEPGEYDLCAPLMALPGRLKATVGSIPWSGSYLGKVDTSDKIRLGLCTKAGEYMDSKGRSMNRTQEMALRCQRGDWVNLNYGENPKLQTWQDTMEVVSGLKAVVTVDTSVMHLAGAMGVPVWVWPGREPNWKFLGGRTDSPFYPSMKVFYRMEQLLEEVKYL